MSFRSFAGTSAWVLMWAVVLLGPAHTLAAPSSTVVDLPGVRMERKQGWFGTGETRYQDALGNTYVKKRGLFGRERTESNLMGSRITRQGRNTQVKASDGTALVTKRSSWLGGEQTQVNGTAIWGKMKDLLNGSVATPPATPMP